LKTTTKKKQQNSLKIIHFSNFGLFSIAFEKHFTWRTRSSTEINKQRWCIANST